MKPSPPFHPPVVVDVCNVVMLLMFLLSILTSFFLLLLCHFKRLKMVFKCVFAESERFVEKTDDGVVGPISRTKRHTTGKFEKVPMLIQPLSNHAEKMRLRMRRKMTMMETLWICSNFFCRVVALIPLSVTPVHHQLSSGTTQ